MSRRAEETRRSPDRPGEDRPAPDAPAGAAAVLTEGSVGAAVMRLAWPVLLSEALHTMFHIVDIIWVGRLGAWATAAISSSMFALWTIFSLANLVGVGLTAHVSRAIGAGQRERAGHVTAQGVLFAGVLGLAVAALGVLSAGPLMSAIGLTDRAAAAGREYLTIFAAGAPLSFLVVTLSASMRAAGDTRTPMIITGGALVANALLDPFLIYGLGPFPRMEVAGAAVATLVCQGAAAAVLAALALRGHPSLPFARASLRAPDRGVIGSLARIGSPYCLVGMLFSANYILFSVIGARFGDAAIAVIGIGNRLESITYLGAEAFAVAAATLVGQSLGAGRPARAERSAWTASAIMAAGATVLTAVFLLLPRPLFSAFTADGEVIALGVTYLRILALCQIATAIEGVLGGAFAGAGNTFPPMVVHVAFGIARPPIALWLAARWGLGVQAIAVTITATCVVRAVLLAGLFLRGRWKTHEVEGAPLPPLPPDEAPDIGV